MEKKEFDKLVDEIMSAVGSNVTRENVEQELNAWLQFTWLNIQDIKRKIIEKFGGDTTEVMNTFTKISNLKKSDMHVNIIAKVLVINKRELTDRGVMYYGIIADETGSIPFTAWKLDMSVNKGDVIKITNAYIKEWQEHIKVIIGNNTIVTKMPPDTIKTVKTRIKKFNIIDLKPQSGRVEVFGEVLEVREKTVVIDGVEKKVYSGIIADETGAISFSAWNVPIKPATTIHIKGAYVKSFRNMPDLVIDNNSVIEQVNIKLNIQDKPISIKSIEERGGVNVKIEGIVLQIKESGLILRCNICKRIMINGLCPEHGAAEKYYDLRIKMVVDDGTGAVTAIMNKELTERILNMSFDEIKKKEMENVGIPIILNEIIEKLLHKPIVLRGNVMISDRGLTMFVRDFSFIDYSKIEEKAEQLLEHVRW